MLNKEDNLVHSLQSVLEIVHKLTDPSLGLSLGQVAYMFQELQVFIITNFYK